MSTKVTPILNYSDMIVYIARFKRRIEVTTVRRPEWRAQVEKTIQKLTDLLNNPRDASPEDATNQTEKPTDIGTEKQPDPA